MVASGGVTGSTYALVFVADERYALGLAVSVHSALTHLPSDCHVDVRVLDNGLSEASRQRLAKVVDAAGRGGSLEWLPVPIQRLEHLVDDPSSSGLEIALYARLLIPDLLAPHIRRAIYLDSDILVRRDLSPLLTSGLAGAAVGAVRDFAITSTDHERSGVRARENPKPYFNAAILIMDLERWRADGLVEKTLRYASAGKDLPFGQADQDTLNGVIDRWYEFDYAWNVQNSVFDYRWDVRNPIVSLIRGPGDMEVDDYFYRHRWQLYRNAAILHFIRKPWHRFSTLPGVTMWVRALMRTGWFEPTEAAAWLVRYVRNGVRYWLGTRKLRLRTWLAR